MRGLTFELMHARAKAVSSEVVSEGRIPRHVAIIMDAMAAGGSARQASRGRSFGGVDAVRATLQACGERGVEFLTLFVFIRELEATRGRSVRADEAVRVRSAARS